MNDSVFSMIEYWRSRKRLKSSGDYSEFEGLKVGEVKKMMV